MSCFTKLLPETIRMIGDSCHSSHHEAQYGHKMDLRESPRQNHEHHVQLQQPKWRNTSAVAPTETPGEYPRTRSGSNGRKD